ncbi:MAG: adenylate/guanylate cyclase domain-containing protein [Flavobacteriales bacterium]
MASALSKLRRRTHRTLRITLAWVAAGLLAALWESNVLADHGLPPERMAVLDRYFWRMALGGLLGGGVYIFLLRDRLRKLPFPQAFGIVAIAALVVLIGLHVLRSLVVPDLLPLQTLAQRLFTLDFLGQWLFACLLMGATMIMVRLNDQFGSGAAGFLLGRYYKPRQELRIFMFLDLRSSTTIAERIGDTRYFQLLNSIFSDITDAVVYSGGDIYQYVGDEISISWPLHRGIQRQNCLRCFFAIRDKLRARAAHYRSLYGIEPVFKAGIHYGQVTTGEVGLVKKQTIFSGDVVNTTAHIQTMCNELGVDLLISKELLDVLVLPTDGWTVRHLGRVNLKGKVREIELYHVDRQGV